MTINSVLGIALIVCGCLFILLILFRLVSMFIGLRIQRMLSIRRPGSDEYVVEIKKCPFCGKNVVELCEVEDDGEHFFNMVCDIDKGGCGCCTGLYDKDVDAVEAWNKRSYFDYDE